MVLMLVLITVDVTGAKVFRLPLPGVFDAVSLLELLIVAFAIPFTHVLRGHVRIEFFVNRLGKRAQVIVITIAALVALVLFVAMAWQMFVFSRTIQVAGVIAPTMQIPISPITYTVAISFCLMCLLLLGQLLRTVKEVIKK